MSDYTQLVEKTVKTRKDHVCDWCGDWIHKGESAKFRKGVWEHRIISEHKHMECWEAMMRSIFGTDDTYAPYDQERGKTLEESGR